MIMQSHSLGCRHSSTSKPTGMSVKLPPSTSLPAYYHHEQSWTLDSACHSLSSGVHVIERWRLEHFELISGGRAVLSSTTLLLCQRVFCKCSMVLEYGAGVCVARSLHCL